MRVQCLQLSDPDYPECLRAISSPPNPLYYLGDLKPLLKAPRLAIVGSRRLSPYGKQVTATFAEQLARSGVVIVSGLALGADVAAHEGALRGGGVTLAVLANGLDQITPHSHQQVAKHILEQGGAIVSEYPVGTPPYRNQFVARNRIVSGISDAVLITEAAARSGTIHTANFALEQGRTVLAVPGNITSALSEGTNNLIKAGATPVTQTNDIFAALGIQPAVARKRRATADNEQEAVLLDLLTQGFSDASDLLAQSQMNTQIFNQTLTMLEITGKIRPLGAGHWGLA